MVYYKILKRNYIHDALIGLGLFVCYLVTAILGLQVDAVGGFASEVWLPTGISLAALLIFGFRFWPAITLGAFIANAFTGAPFLIAIIIGIGNTLEAVLGAYVLTKLAGFRSALDRVRDVLGLLLFAALLSTAISATIGVSSLAAGGVIPITSYLSTWIAWWTGDMISNLIIAPFLLVWSSRLPQITERKRVLEFGGLLLIVVIIGLVVFRGFDGFVSVQEPVMYFVFPPLIWAALRFGQRAAVTTIFLISSLAVWSTAQGFGPFVRESVSESLLYLHLFMSAIAVTTMLLAAAVSERKNLEKKKDEFISVASHELKTPLTSIKVFAQVLQRRFEKMGDKKSSAYLTRINEQIDKLSRLILELLDIGKIQEGKMLLNKEKFKIDILLQEVGEDLSRTTHHNIITESAVKKRIFADRNRISQVITNLLSNAIKYSPQANEIIVRAIKNTDHITVSVKDFGIGISKDEQQKIFDRFYQSGKTRKSRDSGMGLGLYIVKEIVERHNGRIWVESPSINSRSKTLRGNEWGKGCTFYFTLPLQDRKARLSRIY